MRRLLFVACVLVSGFAVRAQPVPTSPEARPRGEPASQSSVPASAPPASTTQTTGTANQDPTVKQMNEAEKAKVDNQGK